MAAGSQQQWSGGQDSMQAHCAEAQAARSLKAPSGSQVKCLGEAAAFIDLQGLGQPSLSWAAPPALRQWLQRAIRQTRSGSSCHAGRHWRAEGCCSEQRRQRGFLPLSRCVQGRGQLSRRRHNVPGALVQRAVAILLGPSAGLGPGCRGQLPYKHTRGENELAAAPNADDGCSHSAGVQCWLATSRSQLPCRRGEVTVGARTVEDALAAAPSWSQARTSVQFPLVYHLDQVTMHNASFCHDMQQDCVLTGLQHMNQPNSQCLASHWLRLRPLPAHLWTHSHCTSQTAPGLGSLT